MPVAANEFVGHGTKTNPKPRPFENRKGRPPGKAGDPTGGGGPTIGPDPNWGHSKQAHCIGVGAEAGLKDAMLGAVGGPFIKAGVDALFDGPQAGLNSLFSAGTAVDLTQSGAEYVAANRGAVIAIRGFSRSVGIRISGNAIARDAGVFGKFAGVLGAALSTKSGYDAYKACMND